MVLLSAIKKTLLFVLLLTTLFACSWALFHTGFFRLHDFTHTARIAELLRALQDGHFPVRWTSNFGFGYGMPLFEFYGPLPFYVGAFFSWLGLSNGLTLKLLYAICSVATLSGSYIVGKKLFGWSGGLLAAVAITLAPYRAVNLFVRGALGEAWGMMALPWVLLGIVKIVKREKHGWVMCALSLTVLFLSHNITSLLFLPVSALFALGYFLIQEKKSPTTLLVLALGYLAAFALSAFYLFPAYIEKDLTKVGAIFSGYFSYTNHFLYLRQLVTPYWGYGGSSVGPEDGLSFFLGYGQILGAVMAGIFFLYWFIKRLTSKEKSAGWRNVAVLFLLGIEVVIAGFMTLQKSQFIWDQFSFLKVVQFPWRWLSNASLFLGLFLGASTVFIRSRVYRAVYVVALSAVLLFTTWSYFKPETFDDVSEAFYYGDEYRIRHDMSKILNDYIPEQMQLDPLSREIAPVDKAFTVVSGDPKKVTLLVDHTHEKLLQTDFSHPGRIEWAIADFPGWRVSIDDMMTSKSPTTLGNIAVDVPAGSHLVGVRFGETPVRRVSDVVSAGAWLSLAAFFVWKTRQC